jgi:hypothetical protein
MTRCRGVSSVRSRPLLIRLLGSRAVRPEALRRTPAWSFRPATTFTAPEAERRRGERIRVVDDHLGVNHETLRTLVRDAEQAARPGAVEATAMEKENRQLRARVKELELEREILWRAAKYFAAETSW